MSRAAVSAKSGLKFGLGGWRCDRCGTCLERPRTIVGNKEREKEKKREAGADWARKRRAGNGRLATADMKWMFGTASHLFSHPLALVYKIRPSSLRRGSPSQSSSVPPTANMSSFADDRSTTPVLRRSGSFLSLADLSGSCPRVDPYVSVQGFIDNREKPFKHLTRSPSSSRNTKATPKVARPESISTYYHAHSPKTPSPLSGLQQTSYETYRPSFPRSKPQPDLYKLAITAHMRSSFQIQQEREIALDQQRRQQLDAGFRIGSPLALSIMNATRDLEVLVASQHHQRDADGDVPMADCPSSSWVAVGLPADDWEMVDCCY